MRGSLFGQAQLQQSENVGDGPRRMLWRFAQLHPIVILQLHSQGEHAHGIQAQVFGQTTLRRSCTLDGAMQAQDPLHNSERRFAVDNRIHTPRRARSSAGIRTNIKIALSSVNASAVSQAPCTSGAPANSRATPV